MCIQESNYRNLSPLINAEVARLRKRGCTKSDMNIRDLAYRNVSGKPFSFRSLVPGRDRTKSMNNEYKDRLWKDGLPHLKKVPYEARVACIQAGIQVWGPVPNELGDEVRRLLDPKTSVET